MLEPNFEKADGLGISHPQRQKIERIHFFGPFKIS